MEAGTHRAKAKSWALIESQKGTPGVAVEFVLVDGGEDITWDGWLSDGAFDRTLESLRYCGFKGENLEDLQGLDANEVELVIEPETYEGKTKLKVQWVNRPGGIAARSKMAPDKVKSFAAQMRDRIRALGAEPGVKRQAAPKANGGPPARQEPPPLEDKDIPF